MIYGGVVMADNRVFSYTKQNREYKKSTEKMIVLLTVLGLAFVVAIAIVLAEFTSQNRELARLDNKEQELQKQLELAQMEAQEIEDLKNKIGTDAFIEQIARDELGLIAADEYIFVENEK